MQSHVCDVGLHLWEWGSQAFSDLTNITQVGEQDFEECLFPSMNTVSGTCSLWVIIFIYPFFVCACVCVYVHTCNLIIYVGMWRSEIDIHCLLFFETGSLIEPTYHRLARPALCSMIFQDQPVSSPRAGVSIGAWLICLLHGCWDSELSTPDLYSKHFTLCYLPSYLPIYLNWYFYLVSLV